MPTISESYPQQRQGLSVVCVSGNIGSGKSSLIKSLYQTVVRAKLASRSSPSHNIFPEERATVEELNRSHNIFGQYEEVYSFVEPVWDWESTLARFYSSPTGENLMALQLLVMTHYAKVHASLLNLRDKCAVDGLMRLAIVERSPFDVLHVFLRSNSKKLTQKDMKCLAHQCRFYMGHPIWQNALILYMDAAPQLCLERMGLRSRPSEKPVDISYLETLAWNYTAWISQNADTKKAAGLLCTLHQVKDTTVEAATEWALSCMLRSFFIPTDS